MQTNMDYPLSRKSLDFERQASHVRGVYDRNRSLELRETVIVGAMSSMTGTPNGVQANQAFKMQRQLFARSERVKGIDFHPVEPWILTTLYSGTF
jgi:hypothetical protein